MRTEVFLGVYTGSSTQIETLKQALATIVADGFIISRISAIHRVHCERHTNDSIHDLRGVQVRNGLCVVVAGHTELTVTELLNELQFRERQIRDTKADLSQTFEILLLAWGDLVSMRPGLVLPHPQLLEDPAYLRLLIEIAGDWVHPVTQQPLVAHLRQAMIQDVSEFYAHGRTLLLA